MAKQIAYGEEARKALQTAIGYSDKLMSILDEMESNIKKLEENEEVAV